MSSSTINLNFSAHNTNFATHGLHAFAAKCPPQLARWAIAAYTKPGEFVLDPMSGSGTTIAEARLLGRQGLGMDIDPLSRLLSGVKSKPLEPKRLQEAIESLLKCLDADFKRLAKCNSQPYAALAKRCQPPQMDRLDYWFLPQVSQSLALIKHHIGALEVEEDIRNFFLIAFSSLILARTSVANARDIVHSRHHYHAHATPPNVQEKFRRRLAVMARQMEEFWRQWQEAPNRRVRTRIIGHDARCIPRQAESIDLVFTSPPYCNALDYVRAHALAVAWLQDVFDVTPVNYALAGRRYIGTDRGAKIKTEPQPGQAGMTVPAVARLVAQLTENDEKMACIVERYFADMWQVFAEVGRVLKTDRHFVVVVCPSHIRKVAVPTHEVFRAMTQQLILPGGKCLKQIACHERLIDERRRLLPYMQQEFGQRMQTEYVLVYQKVAS